MTLLITSIPLWGRKSRSNFGSLKSGWKRTRLFSSCSCSLVVVLVLVLVIVVLILVLVVVVVLVVGFFPVVAKFPPLALSALSSVLSDDDEDDDEHE
jgi:hypothetical protein